MEPMRQLRVILMMLVDSRWIELHIGQHVLLKIVCLQ
jgi:hypothetical protein